MPLAVTHILLTIIVVDLYRDYISKHKRYFPLYTLLIAGIAGLIPDLDIVFRMISQLFGFVLNPLLEHGGIFHTPILGLFFLIPGLFLWYKKKHKHAVIFFVICFAFEFHLFLDLIFGGGAYEGIMLLWPFSSVPFKIHLLNNLGIKDIPIALDAVLLILWLWHEEVKHKISDFI